MINSVFQSIHLYLKGDGVVGAYFKGAALIDYQWYLITLFFLNSFLKHFPKFTMYLIVRFFHICICIIHILSCFVFLVCRTFSTWDSGSEDYTNTSYIFGIKQIILFYSTLIFCNCTHLSLIYAGCARAFLTSTRFLQ